MEALVTKIVLASSIGLQALILLILLKQRLHRRFRWFFLYIAYVLLEAGLRFAFAGQESLYFKVYWLTAIGGVLFSVMALRESFLKVFWMYVRLRWFTRIIWGFVGAALLYVGFRAWAAPPVHADPLVTVLIDLELALDYSLATVGILYFALVKADKIKEYPWESAIVSGFMTIGILAAIGTLARSVFGPNLFSRWAGAAAYLLAEIEWAVILGRPEPEIPKRGPIRELTIDDLTRLDEYIKVLDRMFRRR
jgi:hypothetical protein